MRSRCQGAADVQAGVRLDREPNALYHARDAHDPTLRFKLAGEAKARVRELSADEEAAIFAALSEDFHDAVRFALLTGVRLDGVVSMQWSKVRFRSGGKSTFEYLCKAHRGKPAEWVTLPMTPATEAILRRQRGHDFRAVWTFRRQGARRQGRYAQGPRLRGGRYPITYWNLRTRWVRALAKAGITDFRFHDPRHTAATRKLRATGNLALVQNMLHHANMKYVI